MCLDMVSRHFQNIDFMHLRAALYLDAAMLDLGLTTNGVFNICTSRYTRGGIVIGTARSLIPKFFVKEY